jgi:hypothetical protein
MLGMLPGGGSGLAIRGRVNQSMVLSAWPMYSAAEVLRFAVSGLSET